MEVVRGKLIAEGKTKTLHEALGNPGKVVVANKTAITAFDDPSYTREIASKARYATTTTSRVFELLRRSNFPVAFERQLSENEFIAQALRMIPIEVVVRRYAVGSYLSRHPELKKPEGEVPHRFFPLLAEAFLKTTRGTFIPLGGEPIDLGLDAKKGEEDPLILNPPEREWKLFHPKKPLSDPAADLQRIVAASQVLVHPHHMPMILNVAGGAFLAVEEAMKRVGCHLIDFKVEFGYPNLSSDPMIGDVIDNDSWRLRTTDWLELSKQSFRDGEALTEVERKYGIVAELVSRPEFMDIA